MGQRFSFFLCWLTAFSLIFALQDPWSELGTTFHFANSQPAKKQFIEMELPLLPPKNQDIIAVLNATLEAAQTGFNMVLAQAAATSSFPLTPENAVRRAEIIDTMNITVQRALQVYNLAIVAQHARDKGTPEWAAAEQALVSAGELIARREQYFNVARIASWRSNPTAYSYSYLWAAHSQYYFWRDRMQLFFNVTDLSPCLMNVDNPLDVAFGEGAWDGIAELLRNLTDHFGLNAFGECLSAPQSEPVYPKDAH